MKSALVDLAKNLSIVTVTFDYLIFLNAFSALIQESIFLHTLPLCQIFLLVV